MRLATSAAVLVTAAVCATGVAVQSLADDVVGFTLIDAGADVEIGPLVDGQVVDLGLLPASQLSVRADTLPGVTGSVVFDLDGNPGFRTESAAPYALFGDSGGDYAPWSGVPQAGAHTLTATAYTAAGGSGTPGTPLTIGFTVVSDPGDPGSFAWESRAAAPLARFEAQGMAVGEALYVFGGFFNGALEVTTATDRYVPETDTWSQGANVPEQLTHSPQAADGDTIYLGGGFEGQHPGGSVAEVWAYDSHGDSWAASTPLPADRGGGGLVRSGRTLHYFSGATRTEGINVLTDQPEHWTLALGATESAADDAGSWIERAPLPNPRNHMAGIAVDGVVYAIGGQHGGNENSGNQVSVHAYDPVGDVWTPTADLPLPLGHISASVVEQHGRIVVLAGVTQGSTKSEKVFSYDPSTDVWSALPALPAPRQSPVAGSIGDAIIVTGGSSGGIQTTTWSGVFPGNWDAAASLPVALGEVAGGIIEGVLYLVGEGSNDTLAYQLPSGTWEAPGSRAQRPFPGHHHAAEVVDGKLYLFGGLGNGSDGQVQIYDPTTDTWQTGIAAPFPSGSASSALIGGLVYYAGGIIGSVTTDQAAVYDPMADTWTPIAPMPVGMNHAAHATDGDRFFVIGGRDGGNTVSNGFDYLQIYDPASDSWESSTDVGSALAPLPQARGGTGQGVFFDGELYVLGGETQTGAGATADDVYDRVDVYDPALNSWREASPIPTARHGIWPLVHGGRLYLPGGGVQKGNSQSTIFQTYHFERCGSGCSGESRVVLSGAAEGGTISVQVAGQRVDVETSPGQSLEEISDAIASAVHSTTAGVVSVQAVGAELLFEGSLLDALSVGDPGLSAASEPSVGPVARVPALSGPNQALLAVLLAAAGSIVGLRRQPMRLSVSELPRLRRPLP